MSAPAGYNLLGIVGYCIRGNYDPTVTYNRYDTVYHDGSTFYAKHDNILNVTPAEGDDWGYLCRGQLDDMTSSSKGIGRPDNVTATVSSGVFSVNGAVIPSYIVAGATEYGSGWLSLTSGGAALTPDAKQLYRIMEGTLTGKVFRWNGTAYVRANPEDEMTGATASDAGAHGLVPAPGAGDQDKLLKGDGTWTKWISAAFGSLYKSTNEYSSSVKYILGQFVIHDEKLYICNSNCNAGSWETNSSHFAEVSYTDALNSSMASLNYEITFDSSKNFHINLRSFFGSKTFCGTLNDYAHNYVPSDWPSDLSKYANCWTMYNNYYSLSLIGDFGTRLNAYLVIGIGESSYWRKLTRDQIIENSSDMYSTSKAYAVGDYVIYDNTLYKCITACSAGSWATNSNCFTQTTLTSAVNQLASVEDYSSHFSFASGIDSHSVLYAKRYGNMVILSGTAYTNANYGSLFNTDLTTSGGYAATLCLNDVSGYLYPISSNSWKYYAFNDSLIPAAYKRTDTYAKYVISFYSIVFI